MILLLDMDGPLADFDLAFWDMCQTQRIELDIDGLDSPGRKRFMSDNIPDRFQRARSRRFVEEGERRWFLDLPLVEGSQEGVAALEEAGVDIWVCTKPLEASSTCLSDKATWIKRYFPSLTHKLIMAPNKGMVKGDILLDDAPKHKWFAYAEWLPVIFPAAYNGEGSAWGGIPSWTWGDPVSDLLDLHHKEGL